MPSSQEAQAHVASLNQRKRQPQPHKLMQERPPVYVHNTFDMAWPVSLGGLRTWNIPPCPKDRDFVSLKVPGIIANEYDTGDGNGSMGVNIVMGEDVAKDIVGTESALKDIGLFTTNREWFGVFWSHNAIPTNDELAKAKAKLHQMLLLLVQDGNKKNLEGPSDKPGVGINSIDSMNRKAALHLGMNVPWMGAQYEQMIDCPRCGDRVKPGIIIHMACGHVFDQKRYAAGQPDEK